MKKFMKYRVLPMICVFSCLVSFLVVPVAAAEFPNEFRDYDAVEDWNARLLVSNTMGMNALAQALKVPATANEIFWALVNGQVSNRVGEVNRSELEILAASYTAFFTSTIGETFGEQIKNSFGDVFNDMLARTLIGNWDPYFEVHQHPSSGLYRIKEMTTGLFVVDSAGRYPYAEESSDGFLGTDQWVPISVMDGGSFRMLSKEAIHNLADDVGGTVYTRGNYLCITKAASSPLVDKMVLANEDGKPYVCWKDKNQSATEQERPTTNVTENGNIVEGDDNSVNLDLEGMTMLLPGGTLAFIDQIIYDESTKSYHIDSHDTYNYTVNNYYTWNYYINYTSITYIGQTEEYNKYYEVYYELPDGRDSADLTKEDLEQLNLSVDVIPYGRSADDTSLRSLYHFDGDTKDSSYWNYCTDFTWNKGASLTYMEAGVFDGALYLDETEHDFTITLPSDIGSGDFTVQFRYYQSSTVAPQTDSYIAFGEDVVLRMNGGSFLTGSSVNLSATPVGTWNEVAIMRNAGKFYYYLNGVPLLTASWDKSFGDRITFHFGDKQQTFKYFDELRILDYALTVGEHYTPSSVPFDTNLTLVLPDESAPVADEYWKINNPDSVAFTDFREITSYTSFSVPSNYLNSFDITNDVWGYNTNFCSVVSASSSTGVQLKGNSSYDDSYMNGGWLAHAGLTSLVYNKGRDIAALSVNGSYHVSVLMADGTVKRTTMTVPNYNNSVSYNFGSFRVVFSNISYQGADNASFAIIPARGQTLNILAVDFSTADTFSAEWVESVTAIDRSSMKTPTLAVRTDIDITSYQIGGVRPSIPEKGQVWAMVENDRIVSIQIYNGQAWEGVDGRIWTGQRWIPASSYNIITLQDMYDIVDATPNYEYIYSEAGFWAWWQKSWNAFTEKLFATLSAGGAAGGTSINPDKLPSVPDDESTVEDDGWSFVELLVVLRDGTWNVITGVVSTAYDGFYSFVQAVSDSGSFFDYYDPENEQSIFFIPLEEGASVWD